MRIVVLTLGSGILGSTLLVSCSSHWKLRGTLDTGCTDPSAYYFDGDGDGWGQRNSESEFLCVGDEESGFTAANDLDCDDDDTAITAEGSAPVQCPGQFTTSDEEFLGVVLGDSEYVVIYGPPEAADSITLAHAQTGCAAWGTGLATFSNDAEFTAVTEAVPGDEIAAFIGVEDAGGSWAFTDGSELNLAAYWCDSVEPDTAEADALAMVKTASLPGWCIGVASTAEGYASNGNAHVVCERPAPDPANN